MTAGKPFTVYTRKNVKGKKIFYVKFKNPDGSYTTGQSTQQTNKPAAEAFAYNYLQKNGRPMPGRDVTLKEYSTDFFSWENTWALNKKIEGRRISERYCLERENILNMHIIPALGSQKITDITKKRINDFRNGLYSRGYSGSYINQCLSAVSQILKQAEDDELIQAIPTIKRASAKPQREKGILTVEEANRVFAFKWMTTPGYCHSPKPDIMGYAGNILAASSGLRSSEIQGLRMADIFLDEGYITVKKSWDSRLNRLNETTKTGRSRTVFIPQKVVKSINRLLHEHPAPDNPESFLFYGEKKPTEKPAEKKVFWRSLYKALNEIGISEDERKTRNITFHSWRHFLNSLLINSKIPLQKIQSITGHLTAEMSSHYYHIDDMADVRAIQESMFLDAPVLEGGTL